MPWIYGIARRTQIDAYRRRSRIARHEFQSERLPETAGQRPSEAAPYDLGRALQKLPASQRETILMLKVAGLSLEEVARATGASVGAVKQKAHRGYETLRKLFGGES
jgi:RNA polymerase sigma-70 factor (ECF subfamily)